MNIKYLKYQFTFLVLFWAFAPAIGQFKILEDKGAVGKVQQAIDSIYNLSFESADIIIDELEEEFGDYPGILLLKGFYVSWKYRPIKREHDTFTLFESYMLKGIEKSEEMLKNDRDDVEANFYLMACHAYLAELYVENGQNFKALGEAKSSYMYIKIGFDQLEDNPEFYFSSGIYNYYREKYPDENPFYKSFIWFFRSGDIEEGISMLKKGSQLALFTKAECLTYLFHINLRYEDKPEASIYYAKLLSGKYPNNLYYTSNYIENSIRLNQFEGLLPLIDSLLASDKKFHNYLGQIYYGNYQEKHLENTPEAIKHYKTADKLGDQDDIRIAHYDAMLFLGLARANLALGNKDLSNQYAKKSVNAAEYSAYRKDAEALLNK